jgi:hypothetical protein
MNGLETVTDQAESEKTVATMERGIFKGNWIFGKVSGLRKTS